LILATHFATAPAAAKAAAVHAAGLSPAVRPAGQVQPASPVEVGAYAPSTPGLGGAAAALVLVLALVLGLAWVLKRLPGGGFRQADGLRVVATIALGSRERAAVVQVGGEQLLLGMGAGGVRTLHVLPEPLASGGGQQASSQRRMPDFGRLLAQRLGKDT